MKVLVVGCFAQKAANQRLKSVVENEFSRICSARPGGEPCVELRTADDLADWILRDENPQFTPKVRPDVALKSFCSLDYIVLDGAPALQPWKEELADVLRLVYQVILAVRNPELDACPRLLCSMVGTQMVTYLINLGNMAWHVFNGNGNGQTLDRRDEVHGHHNAPTHMAMCILVWRMVF